MDSELSNFSRCFIVTGGSGFIGKHLIRTLLAQGADRIVSIDPVSTADLDDEPRINDVKQIVLGIDQMDPQAIFDETCEWFGCRPFGIFHMCVIPLRLVQEDPARAITVNIGGTHKVVELAKRAPGCRIVFSSASSVYGETNDVMDESLPLRPTTFYGASKAASELWLEGARSEWGIPYVALRYMNVYGPGQTAGLIPFQIGRIDKGLPPKIEGKGNAGFDFVYVGDVVQANLLAMASNVSGEAFNVGSGEHASVSDICDILQDIAGTVYQPEYVPERPGAVQRRVGSSAKISRMLGYQPRVVLKAGLEKTWEAKTGRPAYVVP